MAHRSQQLKTTSHMDNAEFSTPNVHRNNKNGNLNGKKSEILYQDSTNTHQNKLPVNLFYSAAEYNKMLITNGRSLRKSSQPQIQGYISNLQFINDPIFQHCQQKKQSLRYKQKPNLNSSERKKANSYTLDCICCCCDQFCKQCVKQHRKTHNHINDKKITNEQLQKALQKINSKSLKKNKKVKNKIITSQTVIQKNKPQKLTKKVQISQKQLSSQYLSHKSFKIDNLIYKSLIQFDQMKKKQKINKQYQKQLKLQKDILMRRFEQEVRITNKYELQKQSKNKNVRQGMKKNNSNLKRFQYWRNARQTISKSLRKDRIQGVQPKSLDKYNKDQIKCVHKTQLTPQMIQMLKHVHEKQAKIKIMNEAKKRQFKKVKIQKNLQELQNYRKHYIQECAKKKFKPSQQMIEQAFKNLIQENKQDPNQRKKSKLKHQENSKVSKINKKIMSAGEMDMYWNLQNSTSQQRSKNKLNNIKNNYVSNQNDLPQGIKKKL